jgi:ferredoxin/flavodoxin---NADP+ reductase
LFDPGCSYFAASSEDCVNKILVHERIGADVYRMVVEAPMIAKKRKAGQFVMLRIDENGERIPLTIADSIAETGTITLIYQVVGKTTAQLATREVGYVLADLVGPLGHPTDVRYYGTALCVGGGIGKAPLFPIAQAMKLAGNKVISVVGARGKDLIILEQEIRVVSDELIVCTDDGSHGRKALVTEPVREILSREQVDICVAIGPTIMMKKVSEVTKEFGVRTIVSLNTIMIDGTGMCGGCRVTVGGETKFTCVDGPEFDGHAVDYDQLIKRLDAYKDYERAAMQRWERRMEQDTEARSERLCRLQEQIDHARKETAS